MSLQFAVFLELFVELVLAKRTGVQDPLLYTSLSQYPRVIEI